MTTTPSRLHGEVVPAPPVFSYAQAAKGRTAATTASAIQSHQSNTSGVSTPVKDTSSVNTPSVGSERGDRSVNGSSEVLSRPNPPAEIATPEWRIAAPTKSTSTPASPSFGTASTLTLPKDDKDDDFILVGVTASEARERISRADHNSSERPDDGRRGKKGKKQKNAEKESEKEKEKEKEKEEIKPEILVPAPIPTVNFWAQRSQELSKAKPSPVVGQASQSALESLPLNENGPLPASKDAKKRVKSASVDEADKTGTQNGVPKESSPSKAQKKGVESANKLKEEPGKRAGPRGSRVSEKDEKLTASQLPPPVGDATSWPTPETALEEEKRKAQEKPERDDKDETVAKEKRPKEKWVPVPYVPSVNFSTPIPPRGGRGRGGARGGRTEAGGRPGHSTNGGTVERAAPVAATTGNPPESERQTSNAARSSSLPPPPKRQSNEQSGSRKPGNIQGSDKSRASPSKGESSGVHDVRQAPMPAPDQIFEGSQDHREGSRGLKNEQIQTKGDESLTQPRSSFDRNGELGMRGIEQLKEGGVFNKDASHQSRDRTDRADRGRGGFRGRANHSSFPNGQPHPQHVFTNGHGPQQSNGYPIRQSNGPYSPPLQQPFSNQYMPSPSRGGRGGSRSQSIPTNSMYGPRFVPNGQVPHIAPIQTSGQMFDYHQPMQSMSAIPYNPYIEHVSVLALVTMQLEYYFSIDNLCKDVYLRKHMDSQGFVFLTFISGFKRIQALTQEFDLLRHACQESDIVELVRGADGADRLRRKEGWEKWVLAVEERDDSVRNDGPAYFNHPSPVAQRQHIIPGQVSMSPTTFSPNSTEASFRPYVNGGGIPGSSPQFSGSGSNYHSDTTLSAAVADFAPGQIAVNGLPDALEAETTFSDDEVSHLTLVFLPKANNNDGSKPKSQFHGASRTFSNGSIDGRSIAEELAQDPRQGGTLANGSHGETSPDAMRRSRSPFTPMSPTKSPFDNAPPVMWVKGQSQQAPVSEQNSQELYTHFRARALQNRANCAPGVLDADMKLLYEFWSHFLCRNFNARMYLEFRRYAFEDARENSMSGMKNLISYYDEVLNSKKKVIPEILARHYVELVNHERTATDRPAFERLRAAWRNGALDMKSRKKIDNLVDAHLKEELERAPHQKSDSS